MFGLSFGEIVIIAVLALLLLGADRLPDAAKTLGKGLREFRRATEDLKDQIQSEIYSDERPRPPAVPPVPARPAEPPPPATPENVPGLEAALVEPAAEPAVEPAAEPAADAAPAAPAAPEGEPAAEPEDAPEPERLA
ncbi:MAG TPA: twin-arginine translocase TatA/TatE family subunit [Anaeromyxobacteraceae bacterium]|nr:twin-arginine translocase TatA/TatE family subunit [Anaeromyxobacteraceae bacterium]